MACVVCNDSGYEGQYVEELGGTVCINCIEENCLTMSDKKDLSDNVGRDTI